MSDTLKLLLEMVEEAMLEQEGANEAPQGPGVIKTDPLSDTEFQGIKLPAKKTGLLQVDRIVSGLVASTSEAKTDYDKNNLFQALRKFNDGKVEAFKRNPNVSTLLDALGGFFKNPESDSNSNPLAQCNNFSELASRAMIMSAYSRILNEYESSAGGFVNEGFVANMLGATVVSPGTKIDGTGFDDIADMYLAGGGGRIGISLKTKESQIKGSLRNLMATMGIPFNLRGGKQGTKISQVSTPKYNKLFYVVFGKFQSNKDHFDITVMEVTRDSLIKGIKYGGGLTWSKDGNKVIRFGGIPHINGPSAAVTEKEKATDFILGLTRQYKNITANVKGISAVANARINIKAESDKKVSPEIVLHEKMTSSLNSINRYFALIEGAIMKYASDPTLANLQTLRQAFDEISKFTPEAFSDCR